MYTTYRACSTYILLGLPWHAMPHGPGMSRFLLKSQLLVPLYTTFPQDMCRHQLGHQELQTTQGACSHMPLPTPVQFSVTRRRINAMPVSVGCSPQLLWLSVLHGATGAGLG